MSDDVVAPASPYKGLSPFDDSDVDALLFFGREREREVIVANLLASRLTVLYGESGVGKSSVLRAGVVRELHRVAPAAVVALHDTWSSDSAFVSPDLHDAPEAYLILDQLEEYFVYHGHADQPGTLLHDLPALLRESRVNVLLSLREDALAQLDVLKAGVPQVFANRLHLEYLDRSAARAAILGPVERWSELSGERIDVEPELVEAVLDEVAAGKVDPAGQTVVSVDTKSNTDRIETPYLQLVLERIWAAERERGSDVLRLSTLRELGGAAAIVQSHVESALEGLSPDEKVVAASMFGHLVTPSGTKIAHRAGDLAEYAAVPGDALQRVLAALNRERILRTVDGTGGRGERHEIFHDVLAEPLLAWRSRQELERERAAAARRQRRLVRIAAGALVALAVVAVLAIFAFTQRSSARSEARRAHARELEATSLQQLSVDPERSLLLALDAAHLEPGGAAEEVLRKALIAARLRLVTSARGPVRAVAYSPDGSRIATASADGRARIYDAATGRLVRVPNEGAGLRFVAFSPDGRMILTGGEDGVVALWDVATGKQVARLRQGGPVTGAAFSGDGRLVLASSEDGMTRLWRVADGGPVRTFRAPGAVKVARLSPDGRFVATAAEDREDHIEPRIYSVRTGRLLHHLAERGLSDIAFSPDSRFLATASYDRTTRLWDPGSGRLVRQLEDESGALSVLSFSPDGQLLATGSQDGGVRIWTVNTGTRLFIFLGHTNPVTALAWSRDGRVIASASADRTIRLWAVQGLVEAGLSIAELAGHQDEVTSIAFAPDGRRLVSGSDDWTARVWDARPEQPLVVLGRDPAGFVRARYGAHGTRVVAAGSDGVGKVWNARTRRRIRSVGTVGASLADAELSPNGRVVVTAGTDGTVRLWAVRSGALLRRLRHGAELRSAGFSPDGQLLASAGGASTKLWDPVSGKLVASLGGRGVVAAAWSPDSARLAAASSSGIAVWQATSGRLIWRARVPEGATCAAFSPDDKHVAVGAADGLVRLFDAGTGELEHVLRGHLEPVSDVEFSRDGTTLVTSSLDNDGRTWDVATGKLIHLLRGHFGPVSDVSISPDGRWIVTAGPISAGLWPASTGRLLFYLRGHTGQLLSVEFAVDGRHVLTASKDGTVRTYTCDICGGLEDLVALARQRLERTARALTPTQRDRYLRG